MRNTIRKINNRLAGGVRLINTKHIKVVIWTQMRAARFSTEVYKSSTHRGYMVCWADPKEHQWWATTLLLELHK